MTKHKTFVVSMGCFWCGESEFRDHDTLKPLEGIVDIKVGYGTHRMDLKNTNPTYTNHEGYIESVKITYDPQKISYDHLLKIFWKNIDPFDGEGQFCDQGHSYIAAIFFQDESEKEKAFASLKEVEKVFQNTSKFKHLQIKTKILPFGAFFDAEDYHQNYKQKNPIRYKYYRWNCGRDQRLSEIWNTQTQ